jgi:hypothetical protein
MILVKRGRLGGISEMPLLSLRGQSVSGMYMYVLNIIILQVNPITSENKRWKSNHPEVSQYTGTAPGLDRFDAQFFKVHFRLGTSMDAMSKKILEQTYQAIYDAGKRILNVYGIRIRYIIDYNSLTHIKVRRTQ